jgi:hypothetical protein
MDKKGRTLKVLKTYEIPRVIIMHLAHMTDVGQVPAQVPVYEIRWQFWELRPTFDEGPTVNVETLKMAWGTMNWSATIHDLLTAEQLFDVAVARVNSQIIMIGDVRKDIMNDYDDKGRPIDIERGKPAFHYEVNLKI